MKFTPQTAWKYVGGLTETQKLNCFSFGTPAQRCVTGRKLRKVKGSVCESCYSLKNRFLFNNVIQANERRFKALSKKYWVAAMTEAIKFSNYSNLFRISSSGDINSVKTLANWCEVAKNLPSIRFWLSSRESGIVSEFVENGGIIPDNLCIRLSAHMINGPAPEKLAKRLGCTTSSVVSQGEFSCPASLQGGKCLDCTKCYDRNVPHVSYKLH